MSHRPNVQPEPRNTTEVYPDRPAVVVRRPCDRWFGTYWSIGGIGPVAFGKGCSDG